MGQAIVIAGPTASDKSAVAMALAERLDGVVINADSMQVYADLRILTARPTDADLSRAPHRLFGHVDAATAYSVGRWLEEVRGEIEQAIGRGQVPIIVGGTGLYFAALTKGLSSMPPVPDVVRLRLREDAKSMTSADLHARLAERDPVMAQRLRPTDPQRILRALEMIEATGRSLSEFQDKREAPVLADDAATSVAIVPPRAALKARIARRFDTMIESGALDEVKRLYARGLDPSLPSMRALGVEPLRSAIEGREPLDEAVARSKTATWHYAKRQLTFLRHQLSTWEWVEPEAASAAILRCWG